VGTTISKTELKALTNKIAEENGIKHEFEISVRNKYCDLAKIHFNVERKTNKVAKVPHKIIFATRVLAMPDDLLEAIIKHELAHITSYGKERNSHGKQFIKYLEKIDSEADEKTEMAKDLFWAMIFMDIWAVNAERIF